tara:strand:+ start:288 stop:488 length:201 start_codon:yes stop_codon:yes gene_type:complete
MMENAMEEFIYDGSQDFEENFQRWFVLNCEERSYYNDTQYTEERGREIFADIVKSKWQDKRKKSQP